MGEIVDLQSKRPHNTGGARCLACKHEWVAVADIGAWSFECPSCGLDKGQFIATCVPAEYFQCNCGCSHYMITKTHAICCNCGLAEEVYIDE